MKRQAGFTLVELAVVVFLIGLLATMGLAALNAQLASAAISASKKKQDTIKDTLVAYLGKYKRLPCPATDNSGLESRVTANAPANCTGNFGIVPYATLGLPKSAALDGWENFFSYAVSPQWTLTYSSAAPVVGGTSTNGASNAFNVGIAGVIPINDRSPATSSTTTSLTSNAVALTVSHGKDGLGAYTSKGTQNALPASGTDELANAPISTWALPTAFYQREPTDTDVPTYGAFNDVVTWLSSNDLIAPLTKDGALKSAEAQWADQIANIKNAVIGYMFSPINTVCAPPDSTNYSTLLTTNNIPTADPWGGTLTYTRTICRLNKDGSSRTYVLGVCNNGTTTYSSVSAFTITSTSPSAAAIIVNTGQLIGAYPNILNNNCP